jgi:NAD(P)-dependent dehydrogenase (short-subunit alcohol dehydrogenase family)
MFVRDDLRNIDGCERLVREAVAAFGGLDGVVDGAGVMHGAAPAEGVDLDRQRGMTLAPIHEAGDESWAWVMGVNISGMFKALRCELRRMLAQGSGDAIVNIGSIAGRTGLAGNPARVASTHAAAGQTRNAAIDYADYGIRVNYVSIACTETPMTDAAYQEVMQFETEKSQVVSDSPKVTNVSFVKSLSLLRMCGSKQRMAIPWEPPSAILFLCSDDASDMTRLFGRPMAAGRPTEGRPSSELAAPM